MRRGIAIMKCKKCLQKIEGKTFWQHFCRHCAVALAAEEHQKEHQTLAPLKSIRLLANAS